MGTCQPLRLSIFLPGVLSPNTNALDVKHQIVLGLTEPRAKIFRRNYFSKHKRKMERKEFLHRDFIFVFLSFLLVFFLLRTEHFDFEDSFIQEKTKFTYEDLQLTADLGLWNQSCKVCYSARGRKI